MVWLAMMLGCGDLASMPRVGHVDGAWSVVGELRQRRQGCDSVFRVSTPPMPDIGWLDAGPGEPLDHLVLPVRVSSHAEVFRFVVDTGAEHAAITQSAWDRLGLPPGLWHEAGGRVNGFCGSQPARLTTFDALHVDTLKVAPSWPLYVLDLGGKLDGLIGATAWKQGVLAIDPGGRRVRFSVPPSVWGPWAPHWIPMESSQARPAFAVSIAGVSTVAMLDTGASGTALSQDLVEAIGLALGAPSDQWGVGGQCEAQPVECPTAIEVGDTLLRIEGRCTASPPVVDEPTPVNLGLGALTEHVVLLDVAEGRIAFVPRERVGEG